MTELKGIVIKGIGGFYYVKVQDKIIETTGRGVLKKDGFVIKIGDHVLVQQDGESAVITKVLKRNNEFIRPPVSNIDGMIIVVACKEPNPNFDTIDKLMIMGEKEGIEIAICISKVDLGSEDEIHEIASMYQGIYPIYKVSCEKNQGLSDLKDFIKGKKVALAGASGVGKSTLINSLKKENKMETGDVSSKTNRGRHTTRHVEIFSLDNGGMIYDTPGFSSYDLAGIVSKDLIKFYKELNPFAKNCKFADCKHIKEKECAVRDAVRQGKVNKQRYLSYKKNYMELCDKERY